MTSHAHTLGDKVQYQGQTYYFCNREEAAAFSKDPAQYVWGTDPVCGRKVSKAETKYFYDQRVRYKSDAGETKENTKRFFFCSAAHRDQFRAGPARYLPAGFSLP